MKKFFIIPCILLFTSCLSVKMIPIKGSYIKTPYIDTATISKEFAWDKIIDFFAQNGLSIKIIDKSSGLIVSDETKLLWSFENSKGLPEKKNAWLVLPKFIDASNRKPISPAPVIGEWNIRIKELTDHRTTINVNLVNIKQTEYAVIQSGFKTTTSKTLKSVEAYKSTGVFEKTICEMIKN